MMSGVANLLFIHSQLDFELGVVHLTLQGGLVRKSEAHPDLISPSLWARSIQRRSGRLISSGAHSAIM